MKSLIHIYEGDGKGKTTAAIGLAIRCAGSGGRVLFVQFLKGKQSNEMNIPHQIPSIETLLSDENYGFYWSMTEETKEKAGKAYEEILEAAISKIHTGEYRLLVLDEVIDAFNLQLIQSECLIDFLKRKPETLEVVMTGRKPAAELVELADYVTDMRKIKHPFDQGIPARKGIEH